MKKILGIIGFLTLGAAFGQDSYTFNYRLDYQFISNNSEESAELFVQHYLPKNYTAQTKNSLVYLRYLTYLGLPGFLFLDENKGISVVNSDLNNNFQIGYNYSGYESAVETLYDEVELVKTSRAPLNILNRSCNFYLVNTFSENIPQTNFTFCIDESNEIDNLSFIFPKQNGKAIKGLVLAIASPDESDTSEIIQLTDIVKSEVKIQFNKEKELAAYELKKKELEKLYDSYDTVDSAAYAYAIEGDPYYTDYMEYPELCYFEGFWELDVESSAQELAQNIISSICMYSYSFKRGEEEKYKTFAKSKVKADLKALKKAKMISSKDSKTLTEYLTKGIDKVQKSAPLTTSQLAANEAIEATEAAVGAIDWAEDTVSVVDFPTYESSYKKPSLEEDSYAIDHLEADSDLWNSLPTYCKKIDRIIPNFSSAELKKHAKNYAAQTCDMYLSEFSYDVYFKGTLDAIRAEQLYFSNQRETMNTNDKKLLDEFLNSLD